MESVHVRSYFQVFLPFKMDTIVEYHIWLAIVEYHIWLAIHKK